MRGCDSEIFEARFGAGVVVLGFGAFLAGLGFEVVEWVRWGAGETLVEVLVGGGERACLDDLVFREGGGAQGFDGLEEGGEGGGRGFEEVGGLGVCYVDDFSAFVEGREVLKTVQAVCALFPGDVEEWGVAVASDALLAVEVRAVVRAVRN